VEWVLMDYVNVVVHFSKHKYNITISRICGETKSTAISKQILKRKKRRMAK
jgi:ribosomal silencing factor RsfS